MTALAASARPAGRLGLQVFRRDPYHGRQPAHPLSVLIHALPRPGLRLDVNLWRIQNLPNLWRGLWRIWLGMLLGVPVHYGAAFLRVTIGATGETIELGLASLRVVTTAGVTEIATRFAGTSAASIANFKYMGFGTGTTAENITDTALVTELTTEYATDNTRPTGSQSAATNVYTSVATLSPDGAGTLAITETGIFAQAATGGGTLLDRFKYAAVNLTRSADSLQVTFNFTITAGG